LVNKLNMENMENLNRPVKSEKTFSDFLIVLLKWRKTIILNVFIVSLIAIAVSFMLDKWYTSTANIIPPKSKSGLLGDIGNVSSTIKDLSKTLGRLGTTSTEAYDYLAILQSRRTFDKVIKKFNLREVYEFDSDDYIEEVIEELDNNVEMNVEDEGNITIKVTDKSPQRAAEMANYFVELLNEISIELGTFEAKNNREFIERRYFQVLTDLKNSEDSLKIFSQKYSIYSIAEQTKAAISAAAELKAMIEVQEIELELAKKTYGNDSPLIMDKKVIIAEMKKRLNSMNVTDNSKDSDVTLFTPFSQIPEVGVKYLRYRREFELQTKLLEFILPVYEQAKIEEKKNIPVCLVLDAAVPAEKKSAPKRVIIVVASFLVSLFLSILLALFLESLNNLRGDESRYKKINDGIFIPLKRMFLISRK